MGLQIGLRKHIQPIFIADPVEGGIVGVVGGPDGVDVVPLHQKNIFEDGIGRHRASEFAVELVAVHAPDHDFLSVDEEISVLQLHAPETDFQRHGLKNISPGIFQCNGQRIEFRSFRTPAEHIFHFGGKGDHRLRFRLEIEILHQRRFKQFLVGMSGHGDRQSGRIKQLRLHRSLRRLHGKVADRQIHRQQSVFILFIECRLCEHIIQRGQRKSGKGHLPENSAEPPHVLILQITPIRPLNHLNGDPVGSHADVFGNIEFGNHPASLAHPGQGAVDPDIEERIHSAEGQNHSPVVPLLRDFKFTHIASGRVLVRHMRRVHRERILHIGVMRTPVALHLPVAGDHDILPVAQIGVFGLEALRHGLRIREEAELPHAVQRLIKG